MEKIGLVNNFKTFTLRLYNNAFEKEFSQESVLNRSL